MPDFMKQALEEAEAAVQRGEVPVGAVLVAGDTIVARAGNRTEELNDPTAHAEMLVIREAAKQRNSPRLMDCALYVTKGGAVDHGPRFFTQPTCHHAPEIIGGIEEQKAGELLKGFFVGKR
jgi:tRNA(adenine34) deaminase